eukprot:4339609-Pyramimonas_sp.AAC.1
MRRPALHFLRGEPHKVTEGLLRNAPAVRVPLEEASGTVLSDCRRSCSHVVPDADAVNNHREIVQVAATKHLCAAAALRPGARALPTMHAVMNHRSGRRNAVNPCNIQPAPLHVRGHVHVDEVTQPPGLEVGCIEPAQLFRRIEVA